MRTALVATAALFFGSDIASARPEAPPIVRSSKLFGISVLTFAALLSISQPAECQFIQQGPKLVGTGAVGAADQGYSLALSGDGNTAIVGGYTDNGGIGAAWVYTRDNQGLWTQQGNKLVATDAVTTAHQGYSVALSADGNTAIVGGATDNGNTGATWVYTRSGGVWTQQGNKLVGTGAVGVAGQGNSVAVSADGNTAIVGGPDDNYNPANGGSLGAAWVFTRSGGVWTQQGNKLVGTGTVGIAEQGFAVALSADGNTAIVGAPYDNGDAGATWVFTRDSQGLWTQQGQKLVGTGAVTASQGFSVALSGDGNTAIVGGYTDNAGQPGATWVFTSSAGVWTQQGQKLVATGVGLAQEQGHSVALSADGNTAVVGAPYDNGGTGAAWVFTRSAGVWTQGQKLVGTGYANPGVLQGWSVALSADGSTTLVGGPYDNGSTNNGGTGAAWVFANPAAGTLQVSPATNIAASGTQGQVFSPTSFSYQLSTTSGSPNYSISGIPAWLIANFTSGTVTASPVTVTFSLANLGGLTPGTYTAIISFTNTSTGNGNTTRTATLTVNRGTMLGCMNGGWRKYISFPGPFPNQGQCVSFFAG
jgi:hypothetical protein